MHQPSLILFVDQAAPRGRAGCHASAARPDRILSSRLLAAKAPRPPQMLFAMSAKCQHQSQLAEVVPNERIVTTPAARSRQQSKAEPDLLKVAVACEDLGDAEFLHDDHRGEIDK